MNDILEKAKFNAEGLIPAVVQDAHTREIPMLAYMNEEALRLTLQRRETYFWSRSRQELWHKGEESGHTQKVHEIRLDCDEDVVLLKVEQVDSIACHTGRHSCFFQQFQGNTKDGEWLTVEPVLKDPESIYK